MKLEDFQRWFNSSFWKAFKNCALPIKIPQSQNEKDKLVKKVFSAISTARYSPSIPEAEIVMNKGHGVTRTVPVFCIEDYCVYYFCIKELEDVLCGNRTANTFGGWSLGGKMRQQEQTEIGDEVAAEYGRYSFNPLAWTRAFGEFNSLIFSQLNRGNFSYVLQFDLSNFYDSVRLDMLERWIREEADSEKSSIITLLFYFLNQWNRRNTGLHPQVVGLPQDALSDCSRILANYYLQKYDKFAEVVCLQSGGLYFRYSDDQMILLNDLTKGNGILLLLTRQLDRYGLRVNQKKVHRWEVPKFLEHRCQSIHALFAQEGNNKKPELVRQFVEAYLAIPKHELQITWKGGLPLLNRLVYANLESLPANLFEKIISRFTSDEYLLLADHKKLERVHSLNNNRSRPIDLVNRLHKLGENSVHNAFHYEALAFASQIKNADLKIYFIARLASLEQQMNEHEIR